jgi:hypothetical protein
MLPAESTVIGHGLELVPVLPRIVEPPAGVIFDTSLVP